MKKSPTLRKSKTRWESFFRGYFSAFDISGSSLIEIPDFSSGPQRDAQALRNDWKVVGKDLAHALEEHKRGK
jgi:hypothetical protein